MSETNLVPIAVGSVYAIKAPVTLGEPVRKNEYVDSAAVYGYGIRLVKKAGNKTLNTLRYEFELVGRKPTPRTRMRGVYNLPALQRVALRVIEGDDIQRLERGEPV